MAERQIPTRIFPKAKEDAESASAAKPLPQTADPAYRLAYTDTDFLMRDDLRPLRFQLELMKPELLLNEAGIGSTFVVYGSADRKSTRLNSSHTEQSRMPSSA